LRDDSRDTYAYFGAPLYTYSLAQGIADGFLAPYRVHRIVTDFDATGWRPSKGELDRFGREIPDDEYQTPDFERAVALRARTETIARHLTTFLQQTDPLAKTIVFCVDQEHASEMRRALAVAQNMRPHIGVGGFTPVAANASFNMALMTWLSLNGRLGARCVTNSVRVVAEVRPSRRYLLIASPTSGGLAAGHDAALFREPAARRRASRCPSSWIAMTSGARRPRRAINSSMA
jgi:hypothetical protein